MVFAAASALLAWNSLARCSSQSFSIACCAGVRFDGLELASFAAITSFAVTDAVMAPAALRTWRRLKSLLFLVIKSVQNRGGAIT